MAQDIQPTRLPQPRILSEHHASCKLSLPAASLAGCTDITLLGRSWASLCVSVALQAEEGLNQNSAALHLGLSPSVLCRWKKLLNHVVPLLRDMKKKATHDGRLGQLGPIEDELL